ncbi:MAG: sulfatase-like hydrolase/transferase [Acidobacteria bacterium]|nr:sulfatase-like hydrolase/transferase [Acidobacteriota bacterium]
MRILLLLLSVASLAAAQKPNILWIIAEDMSPDMSRNGTPQVYTPRLDGLADEGVYFSSAFSTGTACSPSRSALWTGMYQTSLGAQHHRPSAEYFPPLPDGVRILPELLKDLGYRTANIRAIEPGLRGTGKVDWNYQADEGAFELSDWAALKENQPFFAQLNFQEAHRGPSWGGGDLHRADPSKVRIPPYYPDHPVTRQDWAEYLDSITALDAKVGRVLDRLETDGLAENTIVFFFSDHGRPMLRGKQWNYDSGLKVPLIVRDLTGLARLDSADLTQLTTLIDVSATTLSLAGGKKPGWMHGRIFLGKDAEPEPELVFGATDRQGGLLLRSRTARGRRFRYIHNDFPQEPLTAGSAYRQETHPLWHLMNLLGSLGRLGPIPQKLTEPRSPEELYDVTRDPYEIFNLASAPEYQAVMESMRAAVKKWAKETGDWGLHGDSPEVEAFFERYAAESRVKRAAPIEALRKQVEAADRAYIEAVRRR